MLLMMATYGLGAAEVLSLRLEDLDRKGGLLRFSPSRLMTPGWTLPAPLSYRTPALIRLSSRRVNMT